MTDTVHLGLPTLAAAQAQKHVTHNEALHRLDALVMLAVLDRDLAAPPASPADGDRYLVKPPGSGDFAGRDDQVAHHVDGGWEFYAPRAGWICFVADEAALLVWTGSAWMPALAALGTGAALQNLALLGLGTTADATNPFSARLNNLLVTAKRTAEGGDGSLRLKLDKESAEKTASLLFQDGYSGRAEIGLTGDDDLRFKVSSDGTSWIDAIRIDRASGRLWFPAFGGPREALSAHRTYHVRPDGSDANSGLADSAAGAFLTIQKALDTIAGLDIGAFGVTVRLADGTYTAGGVVTGPWLGSGTVTVQGNAATPGAVHVAVTSANGFLVQNSGSLTVKDLKISTATSGRGLFANACGAIHFGNVEFGACAGEHIRAAAQGSVICLSNYTISGGSIAHWIAANSGVVQVQAKTITLTGTPAFSIAFAFATLVSAMQIGGNTYVGGATGACYSATENGVVSTGGGTLPGNAAGTLATGGQYS